MKGVEVPDLIVEKRNHITYLTLNRPARRNAYSPEMITCLAESWKEFRDDDDQRVAILTGSGTEAFCVGGDLKTFIPLLTGARKAEDDWENRQARQHRYQRVAHRN